MKTEYRIGRVGEGSRGLRASDGATGRGSSLRRRFGVRALIEALESRVLLTSSGALEVWAGNADLTGSTDAFFSPDQNGYTQLGVTNLSNASVTFDTGGVQYNFFVIVTRGEVQVDSVEGSDTTFLSGFDFTGSTNQSGNVTTIGTQEDNNGGTFAGYAAFANPNSWSNLTIQTGTVGLMLQGQISVDNDYLPGQANPYDIRGEMGVDDNGLITSGEVQAPTGVWYPLSKNSDSGNSDEQWRFKNDFNSAASVTAAMPNGTYTFVLQSPLGITTTQFSYTASSLAIVPTLIGISDGSTGVSTTPTFNWNALNDPNSNNDNLQVELDGPNSNNGNQQGLNITDTSFAPGTLDASSNYALELSLQSFSGNGNSDGFSFNTEITNETDLLFRTAGSASPAPAVTISSIAFPSGVIQPGDWVELPITGGNTGGNAIGRSNGNVVPVQYEAVLGATKTWGAAGNIVLGNGTIGQGSGGGAIGGESFNGGGPFVQIPANTAPGTYWVGLKGDSTGVVSGNTGTTTVWSATQITITASGTVVITSPGNQAANAGDSQSFSLGSFSGSNTTTPYAVDVNWGDGTPDSIFAMNASGAIPSMDHTFVNNGNQTVTETVVDWDAEASRSSTFHVAVTTPITSAIVTWTNPANIVYGTALSGTQLDATANVAGTFVYTQTAGTVLNAGNNQTLSVTFTPDDLVDFSVVMSNVSINVTRAPLTVTADNATKVAGDANPTFTATITGFVNGDSSADVSGTAAFSTTATTGSAAGHYTITPTVGTLSEPNYSFTTFHNGTLTVTAAVAGATKLVFLKSPTNTAAGGVINALGIPQGVIVEVENSKGQVVTTDNSNVTLTLSPNITGGVLGGTVTMTAVNGVATFTDLNITETGSYTLLATDGVLTAVTSKKFTIAADTSTAHLVFFQQGASTVVGDSLAPALIVKEEDQFGNLVTADHSKVTLSVVSGPGTVGGTALAAVIKGIATFSKATLSTAGSYTLAATDASIADATPVQFSQTVTQGTTSVATPHPAASYTAGKAINLTALFKSTAFSKVPFTGTATILDQSSNVLGMATVAANGSVKFSFIVSVANTYTCTLVYPGDTNHTAITSAPFTLLVKPA